MKANCDFQTDFLSFADKSNSEESKKKSRYAQPEKEQ